MCGFLLYGSFGTLSLAKIEVMITCFAVPLVMSVL